MRGAPTGVVSARRWSGFGPSVVTPTSRLPSVPGAGPCQLAGEVDAAHSSSGRDRWPGQLVLVEDVGLAANRAAAFVGQVRSPVVDPHAGADACRSSASRRRPVSRS